jgi:hypothetical protein
MIASKHKRVKATQKLRPVFEGEKSRQQEDQEFNDRSNKDIKHRKTFQVK